MGQIRTVWGKIYRKDIIDGIKFFEDIYIFEDGIFNLYAFLKSKRIFCMNSNLYNYRIQSQSANNRYKFDCRQQVDKYMNYIKTFIKDNNIITYDSYELLVYESFMRLINQFYCSKENKLEDKIKIKEMVEIAESEDYILAFKKLKYKYFNFKNKVLVFLIKNKMYKIFYYLNKLKNYGVK